MVSQLQYNAAANWVREELFQSKLMRENGLKGQYGGRGGPVGTIREEFLPFFDLQPRQSSLNQGG